MLTDYKTITRSPLTCVPILRYQSISDAAVESSWPEAVTPAQFRGQIEWLLDHHYMPISVSEWVAACKQGETKMYPQPVVMTFDNGLADFYTNAWPILRDYALTGTLYLTTGAITEPRSQFDSTSIDGQPMMAWDQVAEVQASGIEIGAQTVNQPHLDLLRPFDARWEIAESKRMIETKLGVKCRSFAYPEGYYDTFCRQAVMQAGFSSAVAIKNALSHSLDDLFALGRLTMHHSTTMDELADWVDGIGLTLAQPAQSMQTRGWRMIRRSAQRFNLPIRV